LSIVELLVVLVEVEGLGCPYFGNLFHRIVF
jgi:hypothetical protein